MAEFKDFGVHDVAENAMMMREFDPERDGECLFQIDGWRQTDEAVHEVDRGLGSIEAVVRVVIPDAIIGVFGVDDFV